MEVENKKLQRAIGSLIQSHSFFASIILQQKIIRDDKQPTGYVNGTEFGYNDDFVNSGDLDDIKFFVAHEAAHIALLHHCRIQNRDPEVFNKAADYGINAGLVNSGFKLPKNIKVFYDPKYSKMSVEDIYRQLMAEKQKDQQNKPAQPSQGQGNPANQGNPQAGNGNPSPAQNNATNQPGKPAENGKPTNSEPQSIGDVKPAKDPANAEEKAKIQTKMAESTAKMCGQLPGGFARELELVKKSRYDYRELLNRFLTEVCNKDYSFMRANRRYLQRGIILPTLFNKTIGKIIVAIDVSGSVSAREVSLLVNEAKAALETIQDDKSDFELTVIYCDAEVTNVQIFTDNEKPLPKGGGGTRYAPVFKYIAEHDIQCEAVIYLTDGECSDFGPAPEYPVLWGLTRDCETFKNPFGEVFKFNFV